MSNFFGVAKFNILGPCRYACNMRLFSSLQSLILFSQSALRFICVTSTMFNTDLSCRYSCLLLRFIIRSCSECMFLLTRAQCYKPFNGRNLRILVISVFVPGRPFQPIPVFVGKAKSLHK